MADIYLTKIERKTIFTRALIYVLILFVIADLTVTGPFFVNFIPWLYVLSILISIRGVDKVLTGIIGTFTVFIASILTNGFNITTLLFTLNAVIQLGLGMLSSQIIHKFVLDHRLVEYIKPKKKVVLILFLVLFTVLSFLILGVLHGDLITYLKSKGNFDSYITKVYGDKYDVKQVIYNRNLPGKYAYVAQMDGEEVYFVPVLNIAFKDANQLERLEVKNENINRELEENLGEILTEMTVLSKDSFSLEYEYTKVGVTPDTLIANISVDTEDNNVYSEISSSIKKLMEIQPHITEFNIVLNGINLHITSDNVDLVTPEYISGGFSIEDLDE